MPIDPTIALQVKPVAFNDPVEMFGKMQTLKHLDQSNQLLGMQQQQLGDTITNNRAVRAIFGPDENFEMRDGIRVLKQDKQNELWRYDPAIGNTYADNMEKMRGRQVAAKKEASEQALREFQIQEKQHTAQTEAATGLLHTFYDAIKRYGGDPTRPEADPAILAKAEADTEQLRPAIRAQLLRDKMIDPNSPETPFSYRAYSAAVWSKEKIQDRLKEMAAAKVGAAKLEVDGDTHTWKFVYADGSPPYDTKVPYQEKFSTTPVSIAAQGDTPPTAKAIGDLGSVKDLNIQVAPKGGAAKSTEAERRGTAQWNEMQQANGTMDQLAAGSATPDGKPRARKIDIAPWVSSLYNMHEEGPWSASKNYFANLAMNSEEQQFVQAARQFVIAGGHQMNGARITNEQFKLLWHTYIGQPNDSEAVLAQKAAARKNFTESARIQAGVGGDALEAQRKKDQAAIDKAREQSAAAPAVGQKEDVIFDPNTKTMVPYGGGGTGSPPPPANSGGATGGWGAPPAAAPAVAPAAPAATPAAAPAAAPAAPVEFPADQRSLLKPGVMRKFTVNGEEQYWTLLNGQPVRVQ